MKKTLLLAGASGLIGKALQEHLAKDYCIHILSRSQQNTYPPHVFYWNPMRNYIDPLAFTNVNAIINVSGENIANKYWTRKQKDRIQSSRVATTNTLIDGMKRHGSQVKVFVNTSAVGYYGFSDTDTELTESSPNGNDFLAQVCSKWEAPVQQDMPDGIRAVILRTGVVLSHRGGILQKMLRSLQYRIVPVLGSGKQYIPWIHIDDMCKLYRYALEHEAMCGVYNAVSSSVSFEEFVSTIRKQARHKNIQVCIPAAIVRLLFGEMASLLLKGNIISNTKIQNAGFKPDYTTIQSAIKQLL